MRPTSSHLEKLLGLFLHPSFSALPFELQGIVAQTLGHAAHSDGGKNDRLAR